MLNHMVILLFFKRLFSIVATPSYTPADGLGGFPFSTPFPVLVICRLPDHGSSNWCEVICVCISLIISNPEHLSMCLLAICMSVLEKCVSWSSAHFLIFFFLDFELHGLLLYFGDYTMDYYSAIKRNTICSFVETWMYLVSPE